MAVTIEGLELDLKQNIYGAVGNIDKLAGALTRLKRAASVSSDLSEMVKQVKALASIGGGKKSSALDGIKSNAKEAKKSADELRQSIKEVGDATREVSNAKVKNPLKDYSTSPSIAKQMSDEEWYAQLSANREVRRENLFGGKQIKASDWVDSQNQAREVAKEAEESAKAVAEFKQSVISAAQSVWSAVKRMGSSFASLASTIKKKLVGAVKDAFKPLKTLEGMVSRIILRSAIRAALRAVTEGLKEGIQNLYQWSAATNGVFKASMDSLSSSFLYLKNSIGAAVSPIINALTPAINAAVDAIVTLLNALNQLFSVLGGALSWTKAVKTTNEFADAAKGAGGSAGSAAKELKNFVMGFDELNMIQEPDSSSGGGGGGGGLSADDYALMFEKAEYSDWAERIKKQIEMGDWEGAGRTLGGKVNALVNSIDWEGAGQTFATGFDHAVHFLFGFIDQIDFINLGGGLARFANQLFDPEQVDWNMFGRLWGKRITVLIDLLFGFVDQFNWENFGQSMLDAITGWGQEVESRLWTAALLINEGAAGIHTAYQVIITGIDWGGVGSRIAQFINDINWKELLGNLGTDIHDAFVAAYEVAYNLMKDIDWYKMGQAVYQGIKNIDFNDLARKFWAFLGVAIGSAVKLTAGLVSEAAQDWYNDVVKKEFTDKGITDPTGLDIAIALFESIAHGINYLMSGGWIVDYMVIPFFTGLDDAFGNKPSEWGKNLIRFLGDGMGESWLDVETETDTHLGTVENTIDTKYRGFETNTTDTFGGMRDTIKEDIEDAEKGVLDTYGEMDRTVTEKDSSMKTDTDTTFNGILDEITTTTTSSKDTFISNIGEMETENNTKMGSIKEESTNSMSGFKSAVMDNVPEASKTFVGHVVDMQTSFLVFVRDVIDGAKDAIHWMKELAKAEEADLSEIGTNGGYTAIVNGDTIHYGASASGGFWDEGQLFLAREAGPELVGTIGNQTAVANNDQIVAGISSGVANANGAVVSAIYTLINAVNSKDFNVSIGDDEIGRANARYQSSRGVSVNRGAFANSY